MRVMVDKEAVEAVGGKSRDMVMHETEQSACRAEAALFFFQTAHKRILRSDKNVLLRINCAYNQNVSISTRLLQSFLLPHTTFS